jgi:CDP-6-deoxy-D-xylo-4-hexulose-3-dehydrase
MGSRYAVMVNSGSSANLLAFAALTNKLNPHALPEGSSVLIPAVCWSTTYAPIIQCGLKPIFVDTDPDTLNLDMEDLERKITHDTKALILVHVMGNPCNMDRIQALCNARGITIIEDTCEALGSKWNGKYVGTFGQFGTFSFYYSHHISTFEGGMVTCNDLASYNLLLCLRAHGWTRYLTNREEVEAAHPDIDPRFCFVNYGFNFRPTDIQGMLGTMQLERLSSKNAARNANYAAIKAALVDCPQIGFANESPDAAWFSMCLFLRTPDRISLQEYIAYLTAAGVENRPVISGNMVRQPVVRALHPSLRATDYPGAEYIHTHGLLIGLPCEAMPSERIETLATILKSPFQ